MKKTHATVFLLLIGTLSLNAQVAFPSRHDNPCWNIVLSYNELTGKPDFFSIVKTVQVKDLCNQQWTQVGNFDNKGNLQAILGFYRVEGEKVYFRENEKCNSRQYLLYDFSLQKNQSTFAYFKSLPGQLPGPDTAQYTIDERKTELIEGLEQTVLYYSVKYSDGNRYKGKWIRGIGSDLHPFLPTICFNTFHYNSLPSCDYLTSVSCVSLQDKIIYRGVYGRYCASFLNTTLFVDARRAGGNNDGTSWQNAFTGLQDALQIAISGVEIWVAQGVYSPAPDGDRTRSFEIPQGVKLYGGFSGEEKMLDERDLKKNITVLSGEIGDPANPTDNSFHVARILGGNAATLLDGFTISGGQADTTGGFALESFGGGAGLFIEANDEFPESNPTIANCVFQNNVAIIGGGVFLNSKQANWSVSPFFNNCDFIDNQAVLGAGLAKLGGDKTGGVLKLYHCRFSGNEAEAEAGAVYFDFFGQQNVEVRHSTFFNNRCITGKFGGIYITGKEGFGSFSFDSCSMAQNRTSNAQSAVGMDLAGGSSSKTYKINLKNCHIRESRGMGFTFTFQNTDPQLSFYRCHFDNAYTFIGSCKPCLTRNKFLECVFTGGLPTDSAHIALANGDSLMLANSLFTGSTPALRMQGNIGPKILQNCTFYDHPQAVVQVDEDTHVVVLSNCLFWGKKTMPVDQILMQNRGDRLSRYRLKNCLFNSTDCYAGSSRKDCGENLILGAYPMFVDTSRQNLRLLHCSPAVDAGSMQDLAAEGLRHDLAFDFRLQGESIDVGAYETRHKDLEIESLKHVTCSENNDGRVVFQYENPDDPIYWTMDDTSGFGSYNLGAGVYTFYRADTSLCADSVVVTINEPGKFMVFYEVLPASGFGHQDGNIFISAIFGGQPPFRFFWNTGDTTRSITNRSPGQYSLQILDKAGCSEIYTFEISATTSASNAQADSTHFSLFPNPLGRRQPLQMRFQIPVPTLLLHGSVINSIGATVVSKPFKLTSMQGVLEIDLPDLPPGVYYFLLKNPDTMEQWIQQLVLN